MKKNTFLLRLLTLLFSVILLGTMGCSDLLDDGDDDDDTSEATTQSEFIETYSDIVYASYVDSLETAEELQGAIEELIANPSEANLEAAQDAWLAAREPYGQTEGYRFYDGPIDDEDGPEGQLNAWPLDEFYIDYVDGDSDAGIINDPETYPTIDAELLISLNELDGDANISTGYHAIEFLLWGQDLTEGAGAGEREFTDYVTDGTGTNDNQDRRGTYLSVVTQLLIDDLQSMVDEWAPDTDDNYRDFFTSQDGDTSVTAILRGIATLSSSELSSERMGVPLDAQVREQEHSCFSDNTDRDIVQNAQSIQNVFLGSYTATDGTITEGTGFYDLLAETDQDLADQLEAEIETTMEAVNEIQAPFDQEILGTNSEGRARVQAGVDALQEQGETLVEAGAELGLTINTSLD